MAVTVPSRTVPRHPLSLETVTPTMAKADLKNLETDIRPLIGRAIAHARAALGWTQKEAAGHIGIAPETLARWEAGHDRERPQFDRLFAVTALREPLVIALAALSNAEVVTEIRFRRPA
jgi:DNA-binding XRE family transcriptional regulator